jgi:translation initiation factor 5B
LVFLKSSKIPVSTICIGDVSKNDLLKVLTPFLQDDQRKKKMEYLTMLCFDVKILPEAYKFGEDNGIKMVTAKIIYHLFDEFTKHVKDINEQRKKEEAKKAVFPCILKQVAVFNKKDPIILGVDVVEGVLRVGTPVCVPSKDQIKVGVVESIEFNKNSIKEARRKTGSVAIRIKSDGNILHGRQFELTDDLVSILTRESLDVLKEHFRDDLIDDDWNLVRKLKPLFGIK